VVRHAFAADLLRAAALAHGVDQLNAIRVNDAEHGRGGQESPRPILMGLQKTKEPGALGKPRKQRPIIARQPPIEGSITDAFQCVQQPHGDDLAGPKMGLGVFEEACQLVINLTE